MKSHRYGPPVGLLLLCGSVVGQESRDLDREIRNWVAPPYWTADRRGGERSTESATFPNSPMPFIGVEPCRIVDTRSTAFPSESSELLSLRPVTFRYKGQLESRRQFGLIAEVIAELEKRLAVLEARLPAAS